MKYVKYEIPTTLCVVWRKRTDAMVVTSNPTHGKIFIQFAYIYPFSETPPEFAEFKRRALPWHQSEETEIYI